MVPTTVYTPLSFKTEGALGTCKFGYGDVVVSVTESTVTVNLAREDIQFVLEVVLL
jgi:hypothetical protein